MVTKRELLAMALATFLSSHGLAKSQIISDFELLLPRQFQQTLIDKKWHSLATEKFTGKWQFPDQQIMSENVPVKIKDILLNISTHLKKPALVDSQTALRLRSKDLSATLTLGEISVDHVIEQEIGGIVGRFRVQALCRNVVLTLKPGYGTFALNLAPAVNGSAARTMVQDVDLKWAADSWTARSIECSGVQGFADLLKVKIDKFVNDSESFVNPQKPLIRKLVQEYLEDIKIDFSESRQLRVSRPDLKVILMVDQYKDLGSLGAKATGRLQIDFLRNENGTSQVLTLMPETTASDVRDAQLRLPKDFVKAVLAKAYTANSWLHTVTSRSIPGFSSLMGSRFIQWFIWPELMKFSKESVFLFDLYSDQNMNIIGDGMNYCIEGTFYSRMRAPKNDQYINFMNFNMPTQVPIFLHVSNGKASATFGKPLMSLQTGWYGSYLQQGRVSKSFSTRTILKRIVGSITNQTVTMDIPSLPIAAGLSLKIKNVSTPSGKDIVLNLGP